MLSRLVKYGIDCGYVLLTALAYVLKDVTKVFLGAAGEKSFVSFLLLKTSFHQKLSIRCTNSRPSSLCGYRKDDDGDR